VKKSYAELRHEMIETQIRARGVKDPGVLRAMGKVPRERFLDPMLKVRAYDDNPLPIGEGQTISQPYIVALMTELLELTGKEKVLEIGTGCGYQTAILAELAAQVFSVERIKNLGWAAEKLLPELGYHNFLVRVTDGTNGWPEQAPYDAIIVAAGAPAVPEALVDQLADKGRLVIPVGDEDNQVLHRFRRRFGRIKEETFGGCRFVKLIGRHGWSE
jgi:protein-L-isoaspartate(D-aspartate) O-methyltransferase